MPACPACGAPLTIDPQGAVREHFAPPYHDRRLPIPTRLRRAAIATCGRCDFAIEIRRAMPRGSL